MSICLVEQNRSCSFSLHNAIAVLTLLCRFRCDELLIGLRKSNGAQLQSLALGRNSIDYVPAAGGSKASAADVAEKEAMSMLIDDAMQTSEFPSPFSPTMTDWGFSQGPEGTRVSSPERAAAGSGQRAQTSSTRPSPPSRPAATAPYPRSGTAAKAAAAASHSADVAGMSDAALLGSALGLALGPGSRLSHLVGRPPLSSFICYLSHPKLTFIHVSPPSCSVTRL